METLPTTKSIGMVYDCSLKKTLFLSLVMLFLGLPFFVCSQTYGKTLEELTLEYEEATTDSVKFASLSSMASAYTRINLDSAVILANQALEGARSFNIKTVEANALISLGEAYDFAGNYGMAIENMDIGLELFLALKNDDGITRAYNSRGLAHQYGRKSDLALKDFEEAIIYAKKQRDLVYQAKIYHNLGFNYSVHDNYVEALQSYLLARNLKDSLVGNNVVGLTQRDQVSTYTNLGALYQKILQFDKARENYNIALGLIEKDPARRLVTLYNIGTLLERDSNYTEAEALYQQSLKIAQDNHIEKRQALIFDALGTVYRNRSSMERAQDYYKQALKVLESFPNPHSLAAVLNNQGILYIRQKQYRKAKENGLEALELAQVIKNQIATLDAHDLLAKAYNGIGEPKLESFHLREYVEQNTVLYSQESKNGLIGLQAVMDVQLAEEQHKRALVDQKNAITEKWNRILVIAFAFIAFLAIALAFALLKVRKTNTELEVTNQLLAESNLELVTANQKLGLANNKLQQFAFATGHDLKESLRNITSFTQLASIQMAEDVGAAQQHLQEAAAGGIRMRKMLDDLLQYSNIGGDDTVVASIPLAEVISSVKQQLKTEIEDVRGDVHLTSQATFKANRMAVEQLFYNLIHNSLRYGQEGVAPRIKIKIEQRNNDTVFIVKDNGLGVSKEYQEDIFKPFHRLHNRMKSGSGLGLPICKQVVDSYGGKIWYENGENEGSTFCFTLPNAEPKIFNN